MKHLIQDIYAAQKALHRMYDAWDLIPPYKKDTDVKEKAAYRSAQDNFYKSKEQAYSMVNQLVIGTNEKIFLKLSDPDALQLYEQMLKHVK